MPTATPVEPTSVVRPLRAHSVDVPPPTPDVVPLPPSPHPVPPQPEQPPEIIEPPLPGQGEPVREPDVPPIVGMRAAPWWRH